jgi:hypothetical protein
LLGDFQVHDQSSSGDQIGAPYASPKFRSENAIPNLRRDTEISTGKSVMVEMMFQQRSRKRSGIMMSAMMD